MYAKIFEQDSIVTGTAASHNCLALSRDSITSGNGNSIFELVAGPWHSVVQTFLYCPLAGSRLYARRVTVVWAATFLVFVPSVKPAANAPPTENFSVKVRLLKAKASTRSVVGLPAIRLPCASSSGAPGCMMRKSRGA